MRRLVLILSLASLVACATEPAPPSTPPRVEGREWIDHPEGDEIGKCEAKGARYPAECTVRFAEDDRGFWVCADLIVFNGDMTSANELGAVVLTSKGARLTPTKRLKSSFMGCSHGAGGEVAFLFEKSVPRSELAEVILSARGTDSRLPLKR